jgi:lipopolysaccharide export system permease protein
MPRVATRRNVPSAPKRRTPRRKPEIMNLLERYLLRQISVPVLGAITALTLVGLLSESLSSLSLIVERGQSPWVLLEVTLLALPQTLSLILPVAVFVGALLALNRLQSDHEFVICYAGGMSRWRAISPAIRLATLIALVSLLINVWVQPLAFRAMREALYKVRTDLAASLLKEGQFTQLGADLTVYTQSVDQNGLLRNLFIHVRKPDGGATSYAAQEGRITKRDGQPLLVLRHGSSQEFSRSDVLNYLTFDQYAFDLSPYITNDEVFAYKRSDLWMHELVSSNPLAPLTKGEARKRLAEANSRLSAPLYNIAFMALALWGVLGGAFSRLGYGRRIARVSAAAAGVRILGFAVQAACTGAAWANVFQYVVPIAVIVFAFRALFRQKIDRYIPWASDQVRLMPRLSPS